MPLAFPELEEVETSADGAPRLGRTIKQNELIEILQKLYVVNVTLKDEADADVTIRVLALDDNTDTLTGGGGLTADELDLTVCISGTPTLKTFYVEP